MLSYEEALKHWGAKQSGIEIDYIEEVFLGHNQSKYGYEHMGELLIDDDCTIELVIFYKSKDMPKQKTWHKEFGAAYLLDIIREIVEIGQSED